MQDRYLFETYSAESEHFDEQFTRYLNQKAQDNWRVRECAYCHGDSGQMYASCLFERER